MTRKIFLTSIMLVGEFQCMFETPNLLYYTLWPRIYGLTGAEVPTLNFLRCNMRRPLGLNVLPMADILKD
jgi:hypothetical protein